MLRYSLQFSVNNDLALLITMLKRRVRHLKQNTVDRYDRVLVRRHLSEKTLVLFTGGGDGGHASQKASLPTAHNATYS